MRIECQFAFTLGLVLIIAMLSSYLNPVSHVVTAWNMSLST